VITTPVSVVGGILEYAENKEIDIIVIGSTGKTGFKKLLLGSIANGVVTYSPCPVFVVK
jgi:nucleotide-binding universal stress UspA family protein